jgi:hypothetical protein
MAYYQKTKRTFDSNQSLHIHLRRLKILSMTIFCITQI